MKSLRHGNYFLNWEGYFFKLHSYKFDDVNNEWFMYNESGTGHNLKVCKTIQITEQILLDLGFEKVEDE